MKTKDLTRGTILSVYRIEGPGFTPDWPHKFWITGAGTDVHKPAVGDTIEVVGLPVRILQIGGGLSLNMILCRWNGHNLWIPCRDLVKFTKI